MDIIATIFHIFPIPLINRSLPIISLPNSSIKIILKRISWKNHHLTSDWKKMKLLMTIAAAFKAHLDWLHLSEIRWFHKAGRANNEEAFSKRHQVSIGQIMLRILLDHLINNNNSIRPNCLNPMFTRVSKSHQVMLQIQEWASTAKDKSSKTALIHLVKSHPKVLTELDVLEEVYPRMLNMPLFLHIWLLRSRMQLLKLIQEILQSLSDSKTDCRYDDPTYFEYLIECWY